MAMTIPPQLSYTAEHFWLADADGATTVGITKYAADAYGEICYVQLPRVGVVLSLGQSFGSVESNKTAASLYTPAAGSVVAINGVLRDRPDLVNQDPYGGGWLFRVTATGVRPTLTADEYRALTHLPPPQNGC